MSLGELAIVAVVAIVCLKPEDAPHIIKTFKELRRSIRKFVSQLEQAFSTDIDKVFSDHEELTSAELNFYLAKIAELEGKYEGDYSLQAVKKHYYSLLAHISEEKQLAQVEEDKFIDKREN